MPTAFVLVRVPAKQSIDLIDDLKKSPHIVEAAGVYGDADVVIKVETNDLHELDKVLFQTIQSNRHVELTRTYVVISDQHWKR